MPTKRAILAELTRDELRTNVDHYELEVEDRRINTQLVDAVTRSRQASLDEILQALSLDRLKELCRAFDRDDSGRKKADLAVRLTMGRTATNHDTPRRRQRPVSAPPTPTPQRVLSVRQPWAWALVYGGKTIENRKWRTRHRGRIWIHAPERENSDDVEEAVHLVAQSRKCNDRQSIEHYREHAQRGAILGSMTLTDCCRLDKLDRSHPLRSNPWANGPWLWLVAEPVARDNPWPTPGRLRLWMPPRPGRDR